MKTNTTKIVFGITAFLFGVLLLLSAFNLFNFKTIIPYWTLFIIVPTVVSMITGGISLIKTIVLAFGVNCLICQMHWGEWHTEQYFAVNIAVCFILGGIYLLFGDLRRKKRIKQGTDGSSQAYQEQNYNYSYDYSSGNTGEQQQANAQYASTQQQTRQGNVDFNDYPKYLGILSSNSFVNCCKNLKGGFALAVLGGVDADLTNIAITSDVTIEITSILGGVDIFVPNNIRVDANGIAILGGCDNFVASNFGPEVPCLHIKYLSILGGIDIKLKQ